MPSGTEGTRTTGTERAEVEFVARQGTDWVQKTAGFVPCLADTCGRWEEGFKHYLLPSSSTEKPHPPTCRSRMHLLTITHVLLALPNIHVDELWPFHTVGQGEEEAS